MSIQEHLNKIRNAVYGHEVRESIAKGIETAYDDASKNGNTNMEVKIARGTNPNLNARLNKMEDTDRQTTAQLAQKAEQTALEAEKSRIDTLIALPDGSTTNDARLEDIAIGIDGKVYDSPGNAVREQLGKLNDGLDNVITPYDGTQQSAYVSSGSADLVQLLPVKLKSGLITEMTLGFMSQGNATLYLIDESNRLMKEVNIPDNIGINTTFDCEIYIPNDGYRLGVLSKNSTGGNIRCDLTDDSAPTYQYISNISTYSLGESVTVEESTVTNVVWFARIEQALSVKAIAERVGKLEDASTESGDGETICIGDSLTAGAFGTNGGAVNSKNYPYYLSQYLNEKVVNKGFGGRSAFAYYGHHFGTIDFSNAKTVIIMLGTNGGLTDTLETDVFSHASYLDYAANHTGRYCRMIEEIQEKAPFGVQIILCTTPYFDEVRMPQYNPPNTPSANAVIPKIANYYKLPVFDVRNELGLNKKNITQYMAGDGLHFDDEKGYKLLGTYIGSKLKSVRRFLIND